MKISIVNTRAMKNILALNVVVPVTIKKMKMIFQNALHKMKTVTLFPSFVNQNVIHLVIVMSNHIIIYVTKMKLRIWNWIAMMLMMIFGWIDETTDLAH